MKKIACFLLVTVMLLALTGVTALAGGDDRLIGTWVLDENTLYTQMAMQYGMTVYEVREIFGAYSITYVFTADGSYVMDISAAGSYIHSEGTYYADGSTVVMNSHSGYPETTPVSYMFDGDRLLIASALDGMFTPMVRSER